MTGAIRFVCSATCLIFLTSHAMAASIADRYEMHVVLDPDHSRIAVSGVVTFEIPLATGAPLQLTLGRGMTPPSVDLVTEGAAARAATASVVDSTEDDFVWTVAPSDSSRIVGARFSYEASNAGARTYFYAGPRYFFAEAGPHSWYPRRPDARARGEVEYECPAGWTVVATGVSSHTSHDGGRDTHRFVASFASELWFVAARFSSYRLDGPVPLTVYSVSPDIRAAALAQETSRTLQALRRIFGKFPYPALSLIEVPPDVADKAGGFNGLGASGAIAFETSFLQPFNLAHVAHELGHQWWGQSLSRRDASEGGDYMMDEAMTEYGALEVVEDIGGAAMAEEYRRHDVPRARGGGNYGALEYLKLAAAGIDTALCCLPDRPTSYRLARSKGARAWYALSQTLGPARFDRALARILARRAHTLVTWDEFLADLERELGPGTGSSLREWFEREGAPRWDVSWTQRGARLEIAVAQPTPAYHLNLELEIVTAAGTRARTIALADTVTRINVSERDTVIDVRLDPHYRVIHRTAEYDAEAAALIPDTQARLLLQEGRNAEAETLLVHALPRVSEPDVYGATFLILNTLARFAEDHTDWRRAAALAERAIDAPTRRQDLLPFAYLRLARASEHLGEWQRALFGARAALAADAASGSRAGIGAECERLIAGARRHGAQSR